MLQLRFWLVLGTLVVLARVVEAAEFTINPLQVYLERTSRASEILVRNDDNAPLRMQVQAMSWRQNADGQDQYEAADDLLYFPRTMEIPPGDSRVIRVGVRAAPVTREDAYRVFIEELPPATSASTPPPGTSLQVLLRVGVPVFVAPAQLDPKAEIARLDLRGAKGEWVVANRGNVHLRAEQLQMVGVARDGTRLFEQQFQERYFLAGVVRTLRFDIPPEKCSQLAAIEVVFAAENVQLTRKLDVAPGTCR